MKTTLKMLGALAVVVLALGAAIFLAWRGFAALRDLWTEQCAVRDVHAQVEVSASPHMSAAMILGLLGVTNGCNLAEMDFERLRGRILAAQPMIKTLEISRRLPGGLSVRVEERTPVARVNYSSMVLRDSQGRATRHGRWDAVDAEGVVFNFSRDDTKLLPMIVESRPSAKRGERLSGKALVALRLIVLCSRPEFAPLRLRDVDVSNATYLKAATGDYDAVTIDWTYPDPPESPVQPKLERALAEIAAIGRNRLAGPFRNVFTVTESGRVNMLPQDRGGPR